MCLLLCASVSLGERQALGSDEVAIEMCIYSEYELQGILSTLSSPSPRCSRSGSERDARAGFQEEYEHHAALQRQLVTTHNLLLPPVVKQLWANTSRRVRNRRG